MSDYIPGCDIVTNFSSFALIVSFIFYNYISSDECLESSVSTVYDSRVPVIFSSFLYHNQSVKIEMLPIYFLMASFHLQYSDIQCPGYKVQGRSHITFSFLVFYNKNSTIFFPSSIFPVSNTPF